jgi:hypothetical protein
MAKKNCEVMEKALSCFEGQLAQARIDVVVDMDQV